MATLEGPGQVRSDTAANWTSTNPTLLKGEWGFEEDTGLAKLGDGATAWTALAYAFQRPAGAGYASRLLITSGNRTINWTTPFQDAFAGAADIVLPAKVGDRIHVEIGAFASAAASGLNLHVDVATIVSSAIVTRCSGSSTVGQVGWFTYNSGEVPISGGAQMAPLVSGDISAGVVRLRPVFKLETGASRTLLANSNAPFLFSARNLG